MFEKTTESKTETPTEAERPLEVSDAALDRVSGGRSQRGQGDHDIGGYVPTISSQP